MTTRNSYIVAREPPARPTCPMTGLSSASRSRRGSEQRTHSELSPIIGSLSVAYLILVSLNAGQLSCCYCYFMLKCGMCQVFKPIQKQLSLPGKL